MLLIACSCVPLDCKIRVCGCMATVFKGMTINKYERNRILHQIKWGSLKIRKQSFPISAHSTSIFDVCSCMKTSRMEVQETEQREFLHMFTKALLYSIFQFLMTFLCLTCTETYTHVWLICHRQHSAKFQCVQLQQHI